MRVARHRAFPATFVEWLLLALLACGPVIYQEVLAQRERSGLPGEAVWLGYTQYDQPFYWAAAREVTERGNGLVAPNPFDLREDAPAIYSHFPVVVLGWAMRLTGIEPHHFDHALRLVLGPLMLLLGVAAMGQFIRYRPLVWPLAFAVIWGSGLAWLLGLLQAVQVMFTDVGTGPAQDWHFLSLWDEQWGVALAGYAGWGNSLALQTGSAFENIYHILALLTALALIRGRFGWAVVTMALTCWSHPFTGVITGLITVLALALECIAGRRRPLLPLLIAGAVFAIFLLYNLWWLPRDAAHREVAAHVRAFASSLAWGMILPAFGIWLALPFFNLPSPLFAMLRRSRRRRVLLVWAIVAFALVFNDRWLPLVGLDSVSPLHFSRGHLMMALLIWSGLGLVAWAKRRSWTRPRVIIVASVVALLSVPDTLKILSWPAGNPMRAIPRDSWELMMFLRDVSKSSSRTATRQNSPRNSPTRSSCSSPSISAWHSSQVGS